MAWFSACAPQMLTAPANPHTLQYKVIGTPEYSVATNSKGTGMPRINISFDMRAPDFGAPASELYKAALEMCTFADEQGFDAIIFPEHHCSPDGYNPVPALMGTAAAAVTKRISIVLGAIVLPLHDPVEVAETIAVADLISNGRTEVTLAAGYVEAEFKAFGKSLHDRAKAMDHGLEIITRALAGERFMDGEREVFVRPLPLSRPPKLYVGGGVPAAAKRAAKFNLGLWALHDGIIPDYEDECRKLGRAPGPVMHTSAAVHVSHDPDAAWNQIGPHVMHLMRSYAQWAGDTSVSSSPFHGLDTVEKVRASGMIHVVTPQECVEVARKKTIALTPLISGLSPKIGWEMLRLFAAEVLPKIKDMRARGE